MDKKKIISSLTLAGMLATSVAGSGVFAAETSDPATKALGEYSKLITGKVAVPFILQSKSDRVTGKDMKISFPGKTVTVDDNAVLKTGDIVNVNGEPRTIVIYGDVNCDGEINIRDAVAILSHVNKKKTLDSVAFAAADLDNDGVLSVREAVGVLSRINSKKPYESIATAPKVEVSKVTNKEIVNATTIKLKFDLDASKYTYAIRDNKAENSVPVSVKSYDTKKKEATLTTALTAYNETNKKTYTLTVKDADGNVVSEDTFKYVELGGIDTANSKVEGDFPVINSNNQNSLAYRVTTVASSVPTTVVVTLKDKAQKEVTGTATLPAYSTSVVVNNFSGVANLKDGPIDVNIKITDEYGNVVEADSTATAASALQIQKDTKALSIANIETTRTNQTVNATVTMKDLTTEEDKKVTKYFIVKKASESAPTASEVVAGDKKVPTTDTALPDVTLTEDVEYTIYVVAVNKYGTVSEMASARIAKATAQQLKTVKPDSVIASTTVAGEFTWEDEENTDATKIKGYKVILYTGDKTVAVKEITEKKINLLNEIKEYAQENKVNAEYKIKVIAVGANSDVANSAPIDTTSKGYTTTALGAPEKLVINTANSKKHQKLTWELNTGTKSTEVAFYNVNIYKYDENNNKAEEAIKTIPVPSTDTEFDLTEAMSTLDEGKYAVTVTALASTTSTKVDSAESVVIATYNVKAPSDLTLSLKDNKTVNGSFSAVLPDDSGLTYEVKCAVKPIVGEIDWCSDDLKVRTNKTGSLYTFTTSTLDANKIYSIRVAVKDQDNEIAVVIKDIKTAKSMIDLSDAKVVGDTIKYSGNILVVKDKLGVEHTYESNTDAPNYEKILNIVKALSAGDKITQSETTGQISVTKVSKGTANYGEALKDVDLTLDDGSTISGTIKSITMGTATKADLSYAEVKEKVVVKAGNMVDVQAGTKVQTVACPFSFDGINKGNVSVTTTENGKVTINGVDISTKEIATVTAMGKNELKINKSAGEVYIVANDDTKVDVTGMDTVILKQNEDNKTISVSGNVNNLYVENGIANITDASYKSIYAGIGAGIETSKPKEIVYANGGQLNITINPQNNKTVKLEYLAGGKVQLSGNVKVSFRTGGAYTENPVKVAPGENGETIQVGSLGLKLINEMGDVSYSVDNNGEITITSSNKLLLVKN